MTSSTCDVRLRDSTMFTEVRASVVTGMTPIRAARSLYSKYHVRAYVTYVTCDEMCAFQDASLGIFPQPEKEETNKHAKSQCDESSSRYGGVTEGDTQ